MGRGHDRGHQRIRAILLIYKSIVYDVNVVATRPTRSRRSASAKLTLRLARLFILEVRLAVLRGKSKRIDKSDVQNPPSDFALVLLCKSRCR